MRFATDPFATTLIEAGDWGRVESPGRGGEKSGTWDPVSPDMVLARDTRPPVGVRSGSLTIFARTASEIAIASGGGTSLDAPRVNAGGSEGGGEAGIVFIDAFEFVMLICCDGGGGEGRFWITPKRLWFVCCAADCIAATWCARFGRIAGIKRGVNGTITS